MSHSGSVVPEYLCQRWHKLMEADWRISEIHTESGWNRHTIGRHIHGKCWHSDENVIGSLKFGPEETAERLLFEPTVCRATQDRQAAAVELCQSGCDLVIVVGGYGSSNTRHLYELACNFTNAVFIEDVSAIKSENEIYSFDPSSSTTVIMTGWLPARRPLKIGVLVGASTPEFVVGQVLERLTEFIS